MKKILAILTALMLCLTCVNVSATEATVDEPESKYDYVFGEVNGYQIVYKAPESWLDSDNCITLGDFYFYTKSESLPFYAVLDSDEFTLEEAYYYIFDEIGFSEVFRLLENGAYDGIEPFNSGNVYLFRNNGAGDPDSRPAEPGVEVEPTTRRYATDPNVPVIPIKTEPVTTAPVTEAPETVAPTLPNIKPKPDPTECTLAPVVTCAPTVKPTGKKTDSKIIENQAKSSASSAPRLNIKTATLKCGKRFNINVYHKNGRKVTFKSTAKKVASVNKNGVVTTLKKGRAKVLVTVGSVTLRCIVKVTSSPSLSKSAISVKKGKTAAVNIIGKAKGVNNKYKNTEYARIVSKKSEKVVRVKGLKRGTTTVKVVVNKLAIKLKVKVK